MINLLPPELKQNYRYARRNWSLLQIISVFGLGLVGLAGILLAGLLSFQQATTTYNSQAAITRASLKLQKQGEVEKQIQEISNNLKLAVQVLSKEVLFSQLLTQLAVVTPNNARLSGITISQIQGGVDITAETSNYNAATQLQINLADPGNRIFDKADIVNVACTANPEPEKAKYPCTVTVRALFAANNPFLFINDKAGS